MQNLHSPLLQPILRPDLGPLSTVVPALIDALTGVIERCIEGLLTWQQRSIDRAMLAEMNEQALRDIGLTRSDVLVEADKPFWRA
jgi:uncharacterized protein YjiS (DUF1127 family)